jgi:CII-binding regulator of phage lambda lysogenization HflD
MYKTKKKRAVDPNAPPRPTLLGHEKILKDAKSTAEQQTKEIEQLKMRVIDLERKLQNQTAYLNELHGHVSRILRK